MDSGATHTRACIADVTGRIYGYGRAGPGNALVVGVNQATLNIKLAARRALQASKLPTCSISVGVAGIAGAESMGRGAKVFHSALKDVLPSAKLRILGDIRIALEGALAGKPGAVIVSGTGSVVFGRNADGTTVKVGGWGAWFGDEGSAQWIGREALRCAAHAIDRTGPSTVLEQSFQRYFRVRSFNQIAKLISRYSSPASFGALAPLVVKAAHEQDRVARQIFRRAGECLAQQAASALSRLRLDQPLVSYQGAVFEAGNLLLTPLRKYLRERTPRARLVAPVLPPLGGAWLIALSLIGESPTAQMINNFRRSYTEKAKAAKGVKKFDPQLFRN